MGWKRRKPAVRARRERPAVYCVVESEKSMVVVVIEPIQSIQMIGGGEGGFERLYVMVCRWWRGTSQGYWYGRRVGVRVVCCRCVNVARW